MLGLMGKKIGMTQVFDENGTLTPVTVVKIEENIVVAQRTEEKNGYKAVVLGSVDAKPKRLVKPVIGQFKDDISPKKYLFEVKDLDTECNVGDKFGIEQFANAEYVDITGTTKGKGFQGAMKRHNFAGGRKTHGSKFHRALGGTGQAAQPSRVFKGTKMAGRMGGVQQTTLNLQVVKVDEEKQVLLVKGAVPGRNNSYIFVRSAIRRN